jgi:hypothetical protein
MNVTIKKTAAAMRFSGGTGIDNVYSPGRYGIFNEAGVHVGNILGNDTQAFGTKHWTAYRITETGGFQRIGRPHYSTLREAKAAAVERFAAIN